MIPIAFLASKLGLRGLGTKLIVWGVIIAAIAIGYLWWKKRIETEAVNRVFQEQIEDNLKKQQEHLQTMQEVIDLREQSIQDFMQKQEKLQRNFRGLIEQIKNGKLKDGEIPEVLQKTLEDIRKMELNQPVVPTDKPEIVPELKPEVQ